MIVLNFHIGHTRHVRVIAHPNRGRSFLRKKSPTRSPPEVSRIQITWIFGQMRKQDKDLRKSENYLPHFACVIFLLQNVSPGQFCPVY